MTHFKASHTQSLPVKGTSFEMTFQQTQEAKRWKEEHIKKCPHMQAFSDDDFKGIPATGEHWAYIFIPSGLGTHVRVKCIFCGKEKDLTDIYSW